MDAFHADRPEETDVYLPTRVNIRPRNGFLHNSVMIVLHFGTPYQQLPYGMARALADHHGAEAEDYRISRVDDATYVLTCAGQEIRDNVVSHSPYDIHEDGVRFAVHRWTPTWGMVYNLRPYEAWISLLGLPLQFWNGEEIRRVVAPIGYPIRVMPYGQETNQFRHITMQITCEHPTRIGRFLFVKEGSFVKRVRVKIHTWRLRQEGSYPIHYTDQPWKMAPFIAPVQGGSNQHQQPGASDGSMGSSSSGSNSGPSPLVQTRREWGFRNRGRGDHKKKKQWVLIGADRENMRAKKATTDGGKGKGKMQDDDKQLLVKKKRSNNKVQGETESMVTIIGKRRMEANGKAKAKGSETQMVRWGEQSEGQRKEEGQWGKANTHRKKGEEDGT